MPLMRSLGGCRAIGILHGGGYEKLDPSKCIYFNDYYDKFNALFDNEWCYANEIEDGKVLVT